MDKPGSGQDGPSRHDPPWEVVDFACGEHHVICVTSQGELFEWGDRSWLEPHRVLPPQVEDEERWGKCQGWYGMVDGKSTISRSFLLETHGVSYVNLPWDINPQIDRNNGSRV